jgi:hypothetical protein
MALFMVSVVFVVLYTYVLFLLFAKGTYRLKNQLNNTQINCTFARSKIEKMYNQLIKKEQKLAVIGLRIRRVAHCT